MIMTAAMASPSPATVPVLIGGFWVVDGILVLIAAVRFTLPSERSECLVLAGLISTILGLVLTAWPYSASFSIISIIAAWGIATGLLIIAAVLNLENPKGGFLLGMSGVLSTLLGLITAYLTPSDPSAVRWVLAHAIAQGYLMVVFSRKLRP